MADKTGIKRRIRSVKSTRQITKAMQLVAASKLRAATAAAVNAQTYRDSYELSLTHAAANTDWSLHELVRANDSATTQILLIGSDRGLVGAYHSRLEMTLNQVVDKEVAAGREVTITTIGTKEAATAMRQRQAEVGERLPGIGAIPTIWEIGQLSRKLLQQYADGTLGRLILITTTYRSTMVQAAESSELLPLSETATEAAGTPATLEPYSESAITATIQGWLQAVIYSAATNAYASEQAMQMLAMQNATSNAGDMIDDLTLAYNNARQAAITQELAEISGGVAALSA